MRRTLAVLILAAAGIVGACEPISPLKNPQWTQPDYSSTHSKAYFQHDPLCCGSNGGP